MLFREGRFSRRWPWLVVKASAHAVTATW